ncbi:hypothetical protein BN1708_013925 [Verticillium longisporum]|uniref:Zn(2)-C6 fungal-type domain-containing protein n=1 Tax=Verticillium longisporum TaxID=100787 RepID=A0A0G4LQZ2_VERLO|nr:hypothetical protein BN1708_013925 [Verticillium longisporum]
MAGGRLLTLACDSCRVRKVKCDARTPCCSNCRSSGIDCKYELPRRKRGPKARSQQVRASAEPRQSPIGESPRGTIPDSPTNGLSDIVSPVKITSTLPLAELSHVDRFPAHVSPTIASRIESHHRQDRASVELTLLSEERLPTPTEIQEALAKDLMTLGSSVDHAARKCIDVFMQYSYPLIPIVQPTNLIASIALLSRPLLPDETTPQSRHSSGLSMKSLEEFRAFTLLTALCASIYAGTNSSMICSLDNPDMPRCFLRASRGMFAHFEERDIEHPTSSSLVIRVLQSSAFHCLGKTHIALYVLSNAHHLALLMRLYDERSFDDMPQPEATIMRAVVWTLYVADKSASVLNHVPSTVQEVCLQEPLTLAYEREGDFGLLSPDMPLFTCSYESRLQAGFTLSNKLWKDGADIILDLKVLARMYSRSGVTTEVQPLDVPASGIMQAYLNFCAVLDSLPPWLRDPESHTTNIPAATSFQKLAFWAQKANLVITFHCLRLTILRRAEAHGCCHLLGLINDEGMLALRKTEIASDLVAAATTVPFEALRANSEPCVEKLRQAGVDLLQITHKTTNQALCARAKTIFSTLLDLIATLNSKVSNELSMGFPN